MEAGVQRVSLFTFFFGLSWIFGAVSKISHDLAIWGLFVALRCRSFRVLCSVEGFGWELGGLLLPQTTPAPKTPGG